MDYSLIIAVAIVIGRYWQFRSPGACSKGSLIHSRSVWVGPSNNR